MELWVIDDGKWATAAGNPADATSPELGLGIFARIRKLLDAILLGRMTGLTDLDVFVEVGGRGIL